MWCKVGAPYKLKIVVEGRNILPEYAQKSCIFMLRMQFEVFARGQLMAKHAFLSKAFSD